MCPIVVTHKIGYESTEKQTILTLSFEHCRLKFLFEILQEEPPDSSRGLPAYIYLMSS